MMKNIYRTVTYSLLFIAGALAVGYYTLPVNRVNMRSRLVMLGDFDGNNKWDAADAALLAGIAADPFSRPAETVYRADANRNGLLDANENDADAAAPGDNRDGKLDRGLAPFVTVYSQEPNNFERLDEL